mgnify:CR=1 FL=1
MRELRDLVPVALEPLECGREGHPAGDDIALVIVERLERRLLLGRPVWNRQGGDGTRHSLADRGQEGHHRARSANAVEADDVRAMLLEEGACILRSEPVAGDRLAVERHRHDRGEPGSLDLLERETRLLRVGERLGDDVVDARLGGPADLLLEHRASSALRLLIPGIEDIRVADIACEESAALGRDLLRERERLAVDLLEQVLLADQPHLLPVRVVRERLDDVGARVDELPVQLRDEIGMLEHDLRYECAGLEVTAPLELEEITLGADHVPALESLEQTGLLPLSGRHAPQSKWSQTVRPSGRARAQARDRREAPDRDL